MKKLLFILLLIFSVFLVNAQESIIIKDARDKINLQDILEVKITVNNNENSEKSYEVTEAVPLGFSLVDPSKETNIEQRNALSIKIFKWSIKVPSKNSYVINYKIKPDGVGEYVISPTKVNDLSNNDVFLSESKQILVSCVPNNKCEGNENMLNCAEDCGTGASDGICDYKVDGICDPDCEDEPDCKVKILNYNYIYIVLAITVLLFFIFFIKGLLRSRGDNMNNASNSNDAVLNAVRSFKNQGYSDEQIKQEFLKKGWKKEDIEKIFDSL
ncbi:MAG: hypothetical protein AABW45_03115 [Nanoarchaeota archaeon]